MAIEPRFDRAGSFDGPLAQVSLDGRLAWIDRQGRIVSYNFV